jgi:V-type H+-transporting ATPase subunit E
MSEEENIEALSRAVLHDAQVEVDQIQSEAKTKADEIRQRAKEQAEVGRKAVLEKAQAEAERLRGQVIASAQLKARTLQLEHRENLLDKVFDAARQKLPSIQTRPNYGQVAALLIREALTQLNAEQAEIRADGATQKVLTTQALEQISKELNVRLTIGKPLESGLGIVVDASNGRLHYDNTLETRLGRLKSMLRSSVYRVLTGEKL